MNSSAAVQFNIQVGDELTWNVMPLLHEIKHALDALIKSGETCIIDLRSIPLAPGEENKILHTLGRGEIQIRFDALGPSEITETQYAGVWLVTHFNADDEIISRFIEITTIPDILRSQPQDVITARESLIQQLEVTPEDNTLEKSV